MKRGRRLKTFAAQQAGLGQPTIMDPAVAAAHGVAYVHMAVFAIDVDRVYWLDPDNQQLPFGWEVFLTQWYLLTRLEPREPRHLDLIEAMCWPLVADAPGEPRLGGQVVFAVHDAVERGVLPKGLAKLFVGWRSRPRDLLQALSELRKNPVPQLTQLAEGCLNAELSPPLASPTREALVQLQRGEPPPDQRIE